MKRGNEPETESVAANVTRLKLSLLEVSPSSPRLLRKSNRHSSDPSMLAVRRSMFPLLHSAFCPPLGASLFQPLPPATLRHLVAPDRSESGPAFCFTHQYSPA